MIGYKVAINNDKRVIITLEIPEDAKTNLHRSNIIDAHKAQYRANKARVLKIEDTEGNEYTSANTALYHKKLTYVKDKVIETNFGGNLETVCAKGIHFFLDKEVAEEYCVGKIENGIKRTYYDNGQKWIETNYVDGIANGLYKEWYENGNIKSEAKFVNGKIDGLYQQWYPNGLLVV